MNILVGCEESQRVCEAFRELGHIAYSCDILKCSGGHDEWHICADVVPLLDGDCTFTTMDGKSHAQKGHWDMIIAFPPCTDLAVSGARWFEGKRQDGSQRKSIEFFCKFFDADCDKIVIENPIGIISGDYVKEHFPDIANKYGLPLKPTQIIHPWMFGDNYNKSTCLWIKGVDPLVPEITEQPNLEWFEFVSKKTGKNKRQAKWFADTFRLPAEERAIIRSRTFPGIAKAMAKAWG